MHPIIKPSAIALLVIAGQTHAAGFQLAEQSATGLGRAFAGEAAIADNASVLSRNAAAMTRFDKMALSGGAIYVSPDVNIEGKTAGLLTHADATAHDIAAAAWVPNAYLIIPLSEQWRLGFSATSYYGLGVKMPDNYSAGHFGNVSDIKTMDLGTSLAYRINEMWSIGAGISAIQGEGEVGGVFNVGPHKIVKHLEGDGWALGWNAGMLLTPSQNTRVGLSYRHDTTLTLEGNAQGANGLTPYEDTGRLDLPLPATAELALFHQLTDKLALHGSLNWTNWSKFVQLEAELDHQGSMHIKDEHWEDSWRYAIGMTYQVTPKWQLRSGVAYDASPVPADRRTISIPDADRLWYSLGMGYQFTPNLTLDLGLTLIDGKKVDVTEKMDLLPGIASTFQGTSEGDAWLAGAQLSYLF
ncbi:OmpP1/FadL family transporter [Aeromonas veronii]|uniref:OmpP1/FadL family transporter n=1 Tax=Aeromonas veronii TaxID=654 RepID=UPI0011162FD3|nr:outer membrane protein transport protein [Aeromonas veronii]MCJ8234243.1 outer membrane protein transport protein [Aeromonas veronii]TNI96349.1 long-chain fatty acid transporter [Aeromonas veronii]